ncbi:hypothetical protein H0R92_00900 [Treponema sp. OMZ 840]|uniref:hypothetical protein n=1 Tax=Treponema sp. OMZ 840 TaxID=244313 RepID=UPI003D9508BD
MNLRQIIKLFIPPIILKIRHFFLNNKKDDSYLSTVHTIQKNSNTLFILGNGPSLNTTFANGTDFFKEKDIICVNTFVTTDFFVTLKPTKYMIADPNNLIGLETLSNVLKEQTQEIVTEFQKKINWHIDFIVPDFARDGYLYQSLKMNKFITFYFYNTKDVSKTNYTYFQNLDENLIAPPAQTVLNTCLWLGIKLKYDAIYLLGADTSWTEQVSVDQTTNELYTIDKHFYGEVKRPVYGDVDGKIPRKLHEELEADAKVLRNYWELKTYAQHVGVAVYNASAYSLIDAFERKKI